MLRRLVILPPLLLHPPWKCQPSGIGKEYLNITRKIMLTLQTLWKDLWEDTRNTQTILFKLLPIKSIYFIFVLFGGQLTLSESFALTSFSGSWLTCRHFTPLLTNLVFQAAHAHTQMLFAFLGRKKKKNLCAQCPEELADSRLSSSLDFLQHELLLGTLNSWQPGPASSYLLILLSSSL